MLYLLLVCSSSVFFYPFIIKQSCCERLFYYIILRDNKEGDGGLGWSGNKFDAPLKGQMILKTLFKKFWKNCVT